MKITNKLILSAILISATMLQACSKNSGSDEPATPTTPTTENATFAKGADVSWLTKLEKEGYKFYDKSGIATECMKLLRDECGVNAIRLRVWVNPADGWNNIADVAIKAKRANDLGLKIMIDFHYSDTWADPGHQAPPAAWANDNIDQMCTSLATHTGEMLNKLKSLNITPEWVQVGNETRTGMLLPLGNYNNGTNYSRLVNAGYDAVKAVFPAAKVIIHLDKGDVLAYYTTIFGYLRAAGAKYDMIGMSLYPSSTDWATAVNNCITNINILKATYGKPVMICEVGMNASQADACKSFITALMKGCKEKTSNAAQGIFYWEPEAPVGYNGGYDMGCFIDGKPTVALDPFKSAE